MAYLVSGTAGPLMFCFRSIQKILWTKMDMDHTKGTDIYISFSGIGNLFIRLLVLVVYFDALLK